MANENPKALPNLFNSDKAIVDLRAAIREVDEHSIVALKDLTRAFNTQKRKLDALEREVKESDTNISDIEAAIEQNNSEIFTVQTIQNKILTQVGKLETLFSDETRKLERKIDDETGVLNKNFQDLSRKIEQSGGFSLTNIGSGLGAKAAKAAPAAEAAVSKRTLASIVPSLAKNAVRGIGGIIASFTTDIVSGVAEATGHPQIAAGADILGDTMVGASLGGMFGPLGAAVGGIVGAGYGAYDKGAQLLGSSEISPYIKDLQTQAEGRTAAREQERIEIEQLHRDKPELSKFTDGKAPDIRAGQDIQPSGGGAKVSKNLAMNQKLAYDAAIAEGLSESAAKILVANLSGESLRNPADTHPDPSRSNPGQVAHGIASWEGSRAEKIKSQFGRYPNEMSVQDQMKALIWEMKKDYPKAWSALNNEQLPQNQRMYGVVKHFENPARPEQDTAKRLNYLSSLNINNTHQEVKPQNELVKNSGISGGVGMSFIPQMQDAKKQTSGGGVPSGDIVALGKWLQSQGVNISEHPSFGGVLGKHATHSAHYRGEAIDINGPPGTVEANDPVWGKKFDALAEQIRSAGYKVIWRREGHFNHIHAQLGGGNVTPDTPSNYEKQAGIPAQATQPTPETPQITAPPMGAAIGSAGMAGMEAQLMGNPMMMMSGMGMGGGMAGMIAGMVAPMLLNSLSNGPNLMSGQLQPSAPQTAELIMPNIGGAPIQPVDETGPNQSQPQVNNVNVMGSYEKGVSSATNQHQVAMNARPDWLGGLAEGLLGATYTGMSRPKYFGAGTGKM